MPPFQTQLRFGTGTDERYPALAGFATVTVPHGLFGYQGERLRPNWVIPDRSTPIIVESVDETNVTLFNPVATPQVFRLFLWYQFTDPAVLWQGMQGDDGSISVLDFGAKGDGVTDDTEAFREAATAVVGLGGRGGRLLVPPGTFVISDQLTFASVLGVRVQGAAPQASALLWRGAGDRPMWSFDRCQDSGLSDLSIKCDDGYSMLCPWWIVQGAGATGPYSAGNIASRRQSFYNIFVDGNGLTLFGPYIRLFDPQSDSTNDVHYFEHVIVRGIIEDDFVVEGFNAKAIEYVHCLASGAGVSPTEGKRGLTNRYYPNPTDPTVWWPGLGGSFRWYGGGIQHHSEVDVLIACRNDPFEIECYNESSAAILHVPDYSSMFAARNAALGITGDQLEIMRMKYQSLRWAAPLGGIAADGVIVLYEAAGGLSFDACELGARNTTIDPHYIVVAPTLGRCSFTMSHGTSLSVSTGWPFPCLQPEVDRTCYRWHQNPTLSYQTEMLPLRDQASGLLQPWDEDQFAAYNLARPTSKWTAQELETLYGGKIWDQTRRAQTDTPYDLYPNPAVGVAGAPLYQQDIANYTRKWLRLNGGLGQRFGFNGAFGASPQDLSAAAFMWFKMESGVADGHMIVLGDGSGGAGGGPWLRSTAGGLLKLGVDNGGAGGVKIGTYDYRDGLVHWVWLVYCRELGEFFAITDQEAKAALTCTYSPTCGNATNKGFGAPTAGVAAGDFYLTNMAWYLGSIIADIDWTNEAARMAA